MAEAAVFIIIMVSFMVTGLYMAGVTNIQPFWILAPTAALLVPGFYAAWVSGPFVPSTRKRQKAMMELASLKPSDVVYDIGCGDGRLVFSAAKVSKKAIGYELSIPLYLFGVLKKFFFRSKGLIRFGDIWNQKYSDANVIFCYLLPKAMHRFYSEIWPTLKPGTRVISNAFPIHETKPNKELEKVYLYVKN